jgi:hypothetical protein
VIQSEEREMKEVKNNLENFLKAIKHNEGVLEEHKKYWVFSQSSGPN